MQDHPTVNSIARRNLTRDPKDCGRARDSRAICSALWFNFIGTAAKKQPVGKCPRPPHWGPGLPLNRLRSTAAFFVELNRMSATTGYQIVIAQNGIQHTRLWRSVMFPLASSVKGSMPYSEGFLLLYDPKKRWSLHGPSSRWSACAGLE